MSNRAQIDLLGDRELKRMLKQLPGASFRKIVRPAMNTAATPVVKMAKVTAPKDTKALARSIGKKSKTYPRNLVVASIVGPRRGPAFTKFDKHGRKRSPAFYAHIVEGGAAPHKMKLTATGQRESFVNSRGQHRTRKVYARSGAMHPGTKPTWFLRRAWEATRGQALQIVRVEMAKRAPIEAKRLAARGKS